MSRTLRTLAIVVLPIITLLLGLQIGMTLEEQKFKEVTEDLEFSYQGGVGSGVLVADPEKEVDISLLWATWRLLNTHYIEESRLQATPMLYGAVSGIVSSLGDPYTIFMTPKENKDFTDSLQGKLQGIGAELTLKDEKIVIVAPLKGSPAEKAGLLPQDIITHVDEVDIAGENLNQVVQRIRGKKGTTVILTIVRPSEGRTFDVTITRDDITVPSVEWEILKTPDGNIGVVTINQFGDGTAREVGNAIEDLKESPLKGLVLDVRFNGGGYLERAVELASMFLRSGKVVTVVRRNGEPVHHYVNGRPIDTETPLVILINEGSASASEILAGALQDAGRAKIIGKKSFGKGTVQEIFNLPGGSSVRITIARWLTPNGKDLGKEGVTPDIETERTQEQIENNEDPQLDAAVEYLLKGEQP